MTRERYARVRRVLAARQTDLTVLMDNVHKPHNLAAVIRSCDAVGCLEVHSVLKEGKLSQKIASGAGAKKWVRVIDHDSTPKAIAMLQERGFRVYAANLSPRSVDYRALDLTQPTCFLLGQELKGVTPPALAAADGEVHIPMAGMVESLNVSVAAAIMLFEAKRQREAGESRAGVHLDDEEIDRLAFEWMQPRVAAYCRRNALPYPALDDEGAVNGPLPQGRA